MTEAEWLTCTDAAVMLDFVKGKISNRKMRLFAVACSCELWRSVVSEGHVTLEIAELYADGHADEQRRENVAAMARMAFSGAAYFLDVFLGVIFTVEKDATEAAPRPVTFDWSGYRLHEWHPFLPLLRHIVGNPFRPYPAPHHWPAPVVELASALYDGQDCGYVLCDALIETGHAELAEHFRHQQKHPKGCWVVDAILGKS
jgi:hypothetical protein